MSASQESPGIHAQIAPYLTSFVEAIEKSTNDISQSMEALKRYPVSEKTADLVVRIAQSSAENIDQVQAEALQHVKQLDQDVDQVIRKLNQIQQQTTQLRDDAQSEKDKHKALNDALESRIRTYDERVNNIGDTHDEIKSIIPILQQATSSLGQRETLTSDLTKQLGKTNANHDTLLQELRNSGEKLKAENQSLRSELEATKKNNASLSHSLETFRSTESDTTRSLVNIAVTTAVTEANEKSSVQCEKEKNLMREAHTAEVRRMKDVNDKLVDELKIEVQAKLKDIETLKSSNEDAKVEVARMKEVAENAKTSREEGRRDLEETRKHFESTRIKDALKLIQSEVQDTLKLMSTLHTTSDQQFTNATTELEGIKTHLENLISHAYAELERRLKAHREECIEVSKQINDSMSACAGVMSRGAYDRNARKVLEEVSELKDENAKILQNNQELNTDYLKMRNELNGKARGLLIQVREKTDLLTEAEAKVENLQKETQRIPDLEARIVNLTRAQQGEADLADQLDQAQQEAARLRQVANDQIEKWIKSSRETGYVRGSLAEAERQQTLLQDEIDKLKAKQVREEVIEETCQQQLASLKEELAEQQRLREESDKEVAGLNSKLNVYDALRAYVTSGKEVTAGLPTLARDLLRSEFVSGSRLPIIRSGDESRLRASPGASETATIEAFSETAGARLQTRAQPSTPTIQAVQGVDEATPSPIRVEEPAIDPKRLRSKGNTPFTIAKKSRVSQHGEAVTTKSAGSSTFVGPPPAMDPRLQREIDELARRAREAGVSDESFVSALRRDWKLTDEQLAQALQQRIDLTGGDGDGGIMGDIEEEAEPEQTEIQQEAQPEGTGTSSHLDTITADQGTTSSPVEITSTGEGGTQATTASTTRTSLTADPSVTSRVNQPSGSGSTPQAVQPSISASTSSTPPPTTILAAGYGRWTMPADFIGTRRDFYLAIRKPENWDDTAEAALVGTLRDTTDLITTTENFHSAPVCYNRRAKRLSAIPANQVEPCDHCIKNGLVCWGVRRLPDTAPPSRQKTSAKKKSARTNWTAKNGFYWEAIYRPKRGGSDDGDGGSAGGDAPIAV